MKRFYELNKAEQNEAIEYAILQLNECIELGLIELKRPKTDALIRDYAMAAVEDALYPHPFNKVPTNI